MTPRGFSIAVRKGDGSACQHRGEARAVVESCRYPPHGHRSASGSGPALGYSARSQGEINSYLNEQTLLIAMLETPEAIENANAIAAIDGIDMLHIGSSDLSTEMGIPGQYSTLACAKPTRRPQGRRGRTANRWGSAGYVRTSNSRPGRRSSECAI
jgi:hypothetical protein